jgi:ABC-type dipeptide/oligopeptide/nickel transport system permease subunit
VASAEFPQEATARCDEPTAVVPLGSRRLAWRRPSRSSAAVAAALVVATIVVACLCAPLLAEHVARTGANTPPSMFAGGARLYPGIAIVVTVLAGNVLGEALRSALAPR